MHVSYLAHASQYVHLNIIFAVATWVDFPWSRSRDFKVGLKTSQKGTVVQQKINRMDKQNGAEWIHLTTDIFKNKKIPTLDKIKYVYVVSVIKF